jgi:hypothetical protein
MSRVHGGVGLPKVYPFAELLPSDLCSVLDETSEPCQMPSVQTINFLLHSRNTHV